LDQTDDIMDNGRPDPENVASFLSLGGETGALMRARDWSTTPFGSPEDWPQSLRSAVSICLGTNYPIAIYWGPELALLYNDAWSDIPGEKHPWALGRPGREVWPEIWDAIGPLFEKVLATGEGVWQEDQLLPMHRHGYTEECYFNFTFSPIRGENGSVEGIFNAVVETTFRVIGERRERTLRELAERVAAARSEDEVFATANNLLSDRPEDVPFCTFYRCDEDGKLIRIGGQHGTSEDGQIFDRVSHEALLNSAERAAQNKFSIIDNLSVLLGRHIPSRAWPEPVERALVVPFGSHGVSGLPLGYLVSGISPRRELDDDYKAFVERAATHVGTAMSNVRAFEEERSRAEALAEIDRAKTTFFSNVSHEFRTPLALMLGPLEDALADAESLIPRERERIEVVHRNGLRLLKLVNSLLDFSRIEAGRARANVEPTDLAQLTTELASNFRSAMEKAGLRYRVSCQPLSRPVPVDRDMWEKIVLNLLSNAFKFTFEGEISVDLKEAAGAAVLTIRDSGTGIPAQELPKLFERFHRIEGARGRSIEGSGIGLALVQELVKFHKGSVNVQSLEGEGTTFTVSIPLDVDHSAGDNEGQGRPVGSTAVRAESYIKEALRWLPDQETASSTSTAAEDASSSIAASHAPRVLLADDNADMRDYVRRLLVGSYRVDVVNDGLAALESIRQDRPDLLLTDIMMPRLDGFGLIRAIREDDMLRDLPVIALSAKAGEEAKVEGLDVGADDYLVKPFSARELVAVVHSTLELAKVRRETMASLRESEARFRNMADHAPVMMWVTDAQASCTYLNRGWYEFTGQTEAAGLGYGWLDATHPEDKVFAEQVFLNANEKHEGFRIEYRLRRADGEYRWAIDAGAPRFDEGGQFLGYVGSVIDITDRKRTEGLQAAQARLLESAMQDVPLETILDDLVRMVEGLSSSGVVASILLADQDGKHLRHGAAPHLPDTYNRVIDGIEIGPSVGSCGTAAFLRKPVYVNDIENDPLWADFRDLALAHDLRACWSSPILSSDGSILGTFALYYRLALEAPSSDRDLLEFVAGSAALIIERRRSQEALRQQTKRLEALNKTAGALAGELDLERLVQTVTDAGVELTGAQFGAFFYNVLDDKGESYMLYTLSGVPRSEFVKFPMPRNTKVFAPTFTGEGIVRSDDITADARYGHNAPHCGMPEGHLPVRSYLAVPVTASTGEVTGGLFFGHPEPKRFTSEHESLLGGIASQASVAFDNARLFRTAQKEIEQRRAAEEELGRLNAHLEERVADEVEKRSVAEQALRQAQKMEAIGQLTGGVAHDFNNLLQVVAGNLQLLSKDIAGNEAATRRVSNALAGVQRGAKLASQLLAFGRRQALEPKVVNIGRFVADTEEMLRRTLGEGIEIETIRGGGLWNASVDPVQVENAILNLAINARDAMDGHGRLTIEVGNAFLDDEYARQHDEVTPGQYVMLAVTDTGSGMSPDIIEQVFQPFFSTKPVGKGTGLGLSMVYGFVKQSGGHIKIYSEVGHGTTIKLYFPRVWQDEDLFTAADSGPISGGSETILVAEDDEGVRNTVVEILSDLGYAVLKAKDATAAMTIVESGIHIDLLFTDVVMPGPLKSADMARQAKSRQPHLAVLFTSGYTENSIVHGGKLDAGVDLLSKPYTREALARKLRHVLNNKKQRTASAIPATTVVGQSARPSSPKPKILLVEDDALIRMATCDMLVELNQTVVEAASAREALEILQKQPIDILITDRGLPGMSGDELARQVRRDYPQIFIIFATGENEMPPLDGERKGLLKKPYSPEEIEKVLNIAAYS
jgi:PAS domain S-box-containing protein